MGLSHSAGFLPVRFAGAFDTWQPEELIHAVISKRLGGDWWVSANYKHERADEVSAAVVEAQKQVLEAFCSGTLRSYVHLIGTEIFYLIPASVWIVSNPADGEDPEGVMAYLAGTLLRGDFFDTKVQWAIPEVFDGAPILIREADAKDWLAGAKIGKAARGAPPQYDWRAFEAEAERLLNEHGGISRTRGEYRLADFTDDLETWCFETWGEDRSPKDTSIKNHAKRVIATWKGNKATNSPAG